MFIHWAGPAIWQNARRCCSFIAIATMLWFANDAAYAKDVVRLEDFAISPNGRVVAFQFLGPKGRGVGLYEWQTGKLTRVPNPPDTYVGEPSFSYDGKLLAMGIQKRTEGAASNIAVFNLATSTLAQLTHGDPSSHRIMGSPVFQPGTGDILYVEHGIFAPYHLKLLNTSTGSERIILDPRDGFSTIFKPFFIDREEIYFQAIGPRNKDEKKNVEDLGASVGATTLTYRLHFGGTPEIMWPELQRSQKDPHQPSIISLSGSRNGENIVGIAPTNEYHEIFKVEPNNNLIQLTKLNGLLGYLSISYDGSIVSFGFNPNKSSNVELFILKIHDKIVVSTNLLEKLDGNRDFILP